MEEDAKAGPQRPTMLASEDGRSITNGEPDQTTSTHCDPLRHLADAAGCKSTDERVAVPLGPEGTLVGGYSMIQAPGSDRGHGPSPAQTTRGTPTRRVLPVPPSDDSDQIAADGTPSVLPSTAKEVTQPPVLHLANAVWLQSSARLPPDARPSQQPRRETAEVRMPRLNETGTGRGYRRHAPTTCRLRFPTSSLPDVSALVDTGASLSTMDAGLARRLGLQPAGETLSINGIGSDRTLGFVTVPFFIDGYDTDGHPTRLHFEHDFHVLPTFSPGVCLGQDWITGHRAVVDPAGRVASMGRYNFHVRSQLPAARALYAKLCTKKHTVVPPNSHSWVEVDTAALLEQVDYTLEPRLFFDPAANHAVMAVAAISDRDTRRVLVTNFGDDALELPSRAILGDVTACSAGTVSSKCATAMPLVPDATPGAPFDPFEFDEQPHASAAAQEATQTVDETWAVGIDELGRPHPGVVELLRRHKQAFSLDGRPGHVKGAELRIPVTDPSQLRAEPPRRVSPEKRQAIERQIAELLEWDVIEESESPVSAPVHLVRQRDKLRFCMDYRHLNSLTIPDRYPLPRVDDVLESLRGATHFSSLDAIRGYHQTDVAEADRWKTAFITHKGLFQYKRVPFGLRSAPAFFQRLMDRLLGPMRWITALVYLDDIVVYTRGPEEHLRALDQLLTAAEEIGLRFSPKKCVFCVGSLHLLGRKVSGHGLGIMEDRASAVRDLSRPHTLHELYHTLGLFGYYRQFIPRFAQIAKPPSDLTKGLTYRKVGSSHQLTRPDGERTSAKSEQLQWTAEHQRSFDALKSAIASPPTLAHPDYDRPFLLYTDASKQGFAAAIHQVFILPPDVPAFPLAAPPPQEAMADRVEWQRAQRGDPIFGPAIRRLEHATDHGDDEHLCLRDGLLRRRDDGRVCAPRALLPALLRRYHDCGGHFGYSKTYAGIARDFWHPRLASITAAYIRHCLRCISTKHGPATGRLDIDADATRPFEHISIDVILGLPRTRRGHDAVMVAVCTFSKMVLLEPCSASFTARDVVGFITNRIVRVGWKPVRLTSDRDLRIMGEAAHRLGEVLGMTITATPAHHHRANPVERHVQTIERVMRTMTTTRVGLWDEEVLPGVELAMNSAVSTATGMTPLDAVFIDSPRAMDHIIGHTTRHLGTDDWQERFALARSRLMEARTLIRSERQRHRRDFDARHSPLPTLEPGSLVWIRLRDRPVAAAPTGKLADTKLGPFAVRRVLSDHRVIVDVPPDLRLDGEFDVSQLEPHPAGEDPFATERGGPTPTTTSAVSALPRAAPAATPLSEPRRGERTRRPGPIARDPLVHQYHLASDVTVPLASSDVFRQPGQRSRAALIRGHRVQLVERPVAFLSRTTTAAESKLTGPELELTCIAWALTRAQHLLEGAQVTVVTDHAPVPGMLTSRTGQVPYGPIVERARVLLRPHLPSLRFVHKPGKLHTNVDALSRLASPASRPGRRASFVGGHVIHGSSVVL